MELGNIKASQEKVARRRVGRGIGSGLGKHQEEVKKDKNQDLVEELDVDLKEVKHHYIEDYQKEDLQTFTLQITQK